MQTATNFTFQQIATLRSPYREKFGIPRQPGLADSITATIELAEGFNHQDTVSELSQFSHLWLVFVFDQCLDKGWKAKVRPPRLGGNQKIGVFASRAPFRPNPIGMSAVRIVSIDAGSQGTSIVVSGADLLDGTPIIDIKPYVPYSDAIEDAHSEFAPSFDTLAQPVIFSEQARLYCQQYLADHAVDLAQQITQVLRCDPRPAYHKDPNKLYGIALHDLNIEWQISDSQISVCSVKPR
ncbi:MAG: tRNA (N6-threonylcarbamoyladenosine(37)-N6)-methyltransferase TrmO [Pseudomonadales bacterium]